MKRTLITLGTLASIAVLPDTAWACACTAAGGRGHRGGGHTHRGGGGFGAGAILGGVIGGHRRCYCHQSPRAAQT